MSELDLNTFLNDKSDVFKKLFSLRKNDFFLAGRHWKVFLDKELDLSDYFKHNSHDAYSWSVPVKVYDCTSKTLETKPKNADLSISYHNDMNSESFGLYFYAEENGKKNYFSNAEMISNIKFLDK